MAKPRWIMQTCETCGGRYSMRSEDLESHQHSQCARCRHLPTEVPQAVARLERHGEGHALALSGTGTG